MRRKKKGYSFGAFLHIGNCFNKNTKSAKRQRTSFMPVQIEKVENDCYNIYGCKCMLYEWRVYNDNRTERKEAFARLEQLRKNGIITDCYAELVSYLGS